MTLNEIVYYREGTNVHYRVLKVTNLPPRVPEVLSQHAFMRHERHVI